MWQIRPQAEATFERTNAKISEHRLSLLSPAVAWFCAASLAGNLAAIDTRYAGLTGAPDESGRRRREKGLAKAGNARVRRGMIQLAWRLLIFQKDSALAQWYRARTANARGATRKRMIVALARKLLIALWRMATTGEIPEGISLRAAT